MIDTLVRAVGETRICLQMAWKGYPGWEQVPDRACASASCARTRLAPLRNFGQRMPRARAPRVPAYRCALCEGGMRGCRAEGGWSDLRCVSSSLRALFVLCEGEARQ